MKTMNEDPDFVLAGLGNPGSDYTETRHNAGFMFLEWLKTELKPKAKFHQRDHWQGKTLSVDLENREVLLTKPMTMMNRSGESISTILNDLEIGPQNLIVVHDDLDIPLGEYRIQQNKSSAGHNGIESIIEHLKTKDFKRVRLGIKPDHPISNPTKFVLDEFSQGHKQELESTFEPILRELKNELQK